MRVEIIKFLAFVYGVSENLNKIQQKLLQDANSRQSMLTKLMKIINNDEYDAGGGTALSVSTEHKAVAQKLVDLLKGDLASFKRLLAKESGDNTIDTDATTYIIGNTWDSIWDDAMNASNPDPDFDAGNTSSVSSQRERVLAEWKRKIVTCGMNDSNARPAKTQQVIARATGVKIIGGKPKNGVGYNYHNVTIIGDTPDGITGRYGTNTNFLLPFLGDGTNALAKMIKGALGDEEYTKLLGHCKKAKDNTNGSDAGYSLKAGKDIEVNFPDGNFVYLKLDFEERKAFETYYVSDSTDAYKYAELIDAENCMFWTNNGTCQTQVFHTKDSRTVRAFHRYTQTAGATLFTRQEEKFAQVELQQGERDLLAYKNKLEIEKAKALAGLQPTVAQQLTEVAMLPEDVKKKIESDAQGTLGVVYANLAKKA